MVGFAVAPGRSDRMGREVCGTPKSAYKRFHHSFAVIETGQGEAGQRVELVFGKQSDQALSDQSSAASGA